MWVMIGEAVLKQKTTWLLLTIWYWAKKTSRGVTKQSKRKRIIHRSSVVCSHERCVTKRTNIRQSCLLREAMSASAKELCQVCCWVLISFSLQTRKSFQLLQRTTEFMRHDVRKRQISAEIAVRICSNVGGRVEQASSVLWWTGSKSMV